MLEYLLMLPCETMGSNMLGYLELIDIIYWENAASSTKSQQLLREILPYSSSIVVRSGERFELCKKSIEWFNKRRCPVKFVRINIELLCDVDFTHSILENIELYAINDIYLQHLKQLKNPYFNRGVTRVQITGNQDPAVMEVMFSLLSNSSSFHSLGLVSSNLSQWMMHMKKLGPCLREFTIHVISTKLSIIKTITEYSPYLEKLSLTFESAVSDNHILQNIANNCLHLRSFLIVDINYNTAIDCISDLTAFAEKCPLLEELNLSCQQLTDQSVIALAQHCSRLKKLKLNWCDLTAASLIALSERGLPLEELDIPWIPIPSAEIAAQCAHALSCVHLLNTLNAYNPSEALTFMPGLCTLDLKSSQDHLLVSHLLQQGHCAGLESLSIGYYSSITPQHLSEIITECNQLYTLQISKPTCISDAVLVELTRSCPHLQKVTLDSNGKVTEEGVLALAVHCSQLREIHMSSIIVTEETVRQLAQHCRHLTKLRLRVYEKEGEVTVHYYKHYSGKEIRGFRCFKGLVQERVRESIRSEVITHRSNNTCCLIL